MKNIKIINYSQVKKSFTHQFVEFIYFVMFGQPANRFDIIQFQLFTHIYLTCNVFHIIEIP